MGKHDEDLAVLDKEIQDAADMGKNQFIKGKNGWVNPNITNYNEFVSVADQNEQKRRREIVDLYTDANAKLRK